jgi:hypothetical protein
LEELMGVKEEFEGIGIAVWLETGRGTNLHENPLAPYLSPTFIAASTSQIKKQCSAFITVPCCP